MTAPEPFGSHPVPVTPVRLPEVLADLIAGAGGRHLRVAVDGAPAATPRALADSVVGPLRARGRPVARVSGEDFLRAASVRLEHGREDPASYRCGWLDRTGLQREVLGPFRASGRHLPTLWDAARDRATRAVALQSPAATVLVVDGVFLLDGELSFDLRIHVSLRPATLARRTPAELHWTLSAFDGYDPAARADVVVRLDDAAHPAVLIRPR